MQVRCSMFVDVVVRISVEEKQSAVDAVDQAPFDVRCYMSVGCSCVSVMAYSESVTFKVVSCVGGEKMAFQALEDRGSLGIAPSGVEGRFRGVGGGLG